MKQTLIGTLIAILTMASFVASARDSLTPEQLKHYRITMAKSLYTSEKAARLSWAFRVGSSFKINQVVAIDFSIKAFKAFNLDEAEKMENAPDEGMIYDLYTGYFRVLAMSTDRRTLVVEHSYENLEEFSTRVALSQGKSGRTVATAVYLISAKSLETVIDARAADKTKEVYDANINF